MRSDKRQVTGDTKVFASREAISCQVSRVTRHIGAFTLVEMLVVIAILGILAALVVPALKNLGKADAAVSASREMLDALARARQLAINNHTTVYLVFVPTNFWSSGLGPALTAAQLADATNLCDRQLSGYTFIAYGAVGDQPGQHVWNYLNKWQSLPEGTFIAPWKFRPRSALLTINNLAGGVSYPVQGFDSTNNIPFPTQDSPVTVNTPYLPYIAFNYLGQLVSGQHEYIPLARGSVTPAIDSSTKALQFLPAQVTESPPGNSTNFGFNLVDIDPLTGRATMRFQSVQ